MIKLEPGTLDLAQCEKSLDEYEDFLNATKEIEETGLGSLQEFFEKRLDLLLLMGDMFGPGFWPTHYQKEFTLFNEFRADYVVSDQTKQKFLFIEFEDAKEHSIFSEKSDSKTGTSYHWSRRFEHGFSQIVDWQFRIDDYRRSIKVEEHFGSDDIAFQGVLVIGRDCFLKKHGTQRRFDWRLKNITVQSRPIHCLTFDKLRREMVGRLENLKLLLAGNLP